MDESVRKAMERWPNVPAVHGWLGLDTAGHWRLKGEIITHPGLVAFINRNYTCDAGGRWFFQNGPQRGYVRLEYTPWVVHVDAEGHLHTHTGVRIERVDGAWIDDEGNLLLHFAAGIGLVDSEALTVVSDWLVIPEPDTQDMDCAIESLQRGDAAPLQLQFGPSPVKVHPIARADVAQRFGFVADPQPESH